MKREVLAYLLARGVFIDDKYRKIADLLSPTWEKYQAEIGKRIFFTFGRGDMEYIIPEETKLLYEHIDEYYKTLLSTRKLKMVSSDPEVRVTDPLLYDYLWSEKNLAEESYYTRPAYQVLFEEICKNEGSSEFAEVLQIEEKDVMRELRKKDNYQVIMKLTAYMEKERDLEYLKHYLFESLISEEDLEYLCDYSGIYYENVVSRLQGQKYERSILNIHRRTELMARSKKRIKEMGLEVENKNGTYEWKETTEAEGVHFVKEELMLPYRFDEVCCCVGEHSTLAVENQYKYAHMRNGRIVSDFFSSTELRDYGKIQLYFYWNQGSDTIKIYSVQGHILEYQVGHTLGDSGDEEDFISHIVARMYGQELVVVFPRKGGVDVFSSNNVQYFIFNKDIGIRDSFNIYKDTEGKINIYKKNDEKTLFLKHRTEQISLPCTATIDLEFGKALFKQGTTVEFLTVIESDHSRLKSDSHYSVHRIHGYIFLVDEDNREVFRIPRMDEYMFQEKEENSGKFYANIQGVEISAGIWKGDVGFPRIVDTFIHPLKLDSHTVVFAHVIKKFPEYFHIHNFALMNGSLVVSGYNKNTKVIEIYSLTPGEQNGQSLMLESIIGTYPNEDFQSFFVYKNQVYIVKQLDHRMIGNRGWYDYSVEKEGIEIIPKFSLPSSGGVYTGEQVSLQVNVIGPLSVLYFDILMNKYYIYRDMGTSEKSKEAEKELSLLNFLSTRNHTSEEVDAMREEHFPRDILNESTKNIYIKKMRRKIGKLIGKEPELLLGHMSVRSGMNEEKIVRDIMEILLPEPVLPEQKKTPSFESAKNYFRTQFSDIVKKLKRDPSLSSDIPRQIPIVTRWHDQSQRPMLDGDPMMKGKIELMRLSAPVNGMFADGLMISYDPKTNLWTRGVLPVEGSFEGDTRQVEVCIPVNGRGTYVLPKPVSSRILPESIQSDTKGKLIMQTDTAGFVKVELPEDLSAKTLMYSLEFPEKPAEYEAYSMKDYIASMKTMKDDMYTSLSANIATLPLEYSVFLKSIEALHPLEKLVKILTFIQEIGFYDMQNGEVNKQKWKMSPEEKVKFMYERMSELKKKTENETSDKQLAGVCADFALLATILLRKAGLCAGILQGMLVQSKTVLTEADAHAISFVVWPSKSEGKFRIIPVDATPGVALESIISKITVINESLPKEISLDVEKEKTYLPTTFEEQEVQVSKTYIFEKKFIEKYQLTLPAEDLKNAFSLLLYAPNKLTKEILSSDERKEKFKEYIHNMLSMQGQNEEDVEPEKAISTIAKDGDMTPEQVVDFLRELGRE